MPIFLPGEFHGHRSLTGYSPWDHKESDRTDRLTFSHSLLKRKGIARLLRVKRLRKGEESRWRRNRTGDHFLFYKFIERTTER